MLAYDETIHARLGTEVYAGQTILGYVGPPGKYHRNHLHLSIVDESNVHQPESCAAAMTRRGMIPLLISRLIRNKPAVLNLLSQSPLV